MSILVENIIVIEILIAITKTTILVS
jgi:hypothetical protein